MLSFFFLLFFIAHIIQDFFLLFTARSVSYSVSTFILVHFLPHFVWDFLLFIKHFTLCLLLLFRFYSSFFYCSFSAIFFCYRCIISPVSYFHSCLHSCFFLYCSVSIFLCLRPISVPTFIPVSPWFPLVFDAFWVLFHTSIPVIIHVSYIAQFWFSFISDAFQVLSHTSVPTFIPVSPWFPFVYDAFWFLSHTYDPLFSPVPFIARVLPVRCFSRLSSLREVPWKFVPRWYCIL